MTLAAVAPCLPAMRRTQLDLAVIGNSRIGALIDTRASIVWCCVPRFDGDPVFCALVDDDATHGRFDITLDGGAVSEQAYERNSAVLRSVARTSGAEGGGDAIEIIDFAPRFLLRGRMFAPVTLVRIVRPLAGRPRIRVRFAPRCEHGAKMAPLSWGSHHIRAQVPGYPLRLTTDAPITPVIEERPLILDRPLTFILGPDESLAESPLEAGRWMLEQTLTYWRRWVRNLAIPFEWQEAVIRAAITLKLNTFDDTGAVIAALTTSIPEARDSGRNWDYRYCWLRDAYFVINALNRLGSTGSMERYLRYLEGIVADAGAQAELPLQPVYALSGQAQLDEHEQPALRGFRGMGPVRTGNLAYAQHQHDAYGAAILGVAHAFFDARLDRPGDDPLLAELERLGERAFALHDVPDAGIWEFRGRTAVHTFSALMCWAACDRLARIATHRGDAARAAQWRDRAGTVRAAIEARAWNPALNAFVAEMPADGARSDVLDASLLLMGELDFLRADDPRLAGTVRAIERQLRRGDFLLRYDRADDFGLPETAFLVCTFWWVQALALIGERARAREEFERLLACRNRFGLLSEDIDAASGELWGNYPQTYSLVGIIVCAMRLSRRWDDAF
jgi:GH15 family glucan-1,4-alpha-glucosidase